MILRTVLLLLLVLLSAPPALAVGSTGAVVLYAYHLKPPFITDLEHRQGLYFDFADYANRKLGRPALRLEYEPRRRLERHVFSPDFDGAVIGVSPIWFKDKDESRFLWTPPLMHDRDEVVSRRRQPVEYTGPRSLDGKIFGAASGYYYFGVDELVKKGKIRREDTVSEQQNLHKLLLGRLDFAIVSRSTFDYLMRQPGQAGRFYLSPKPHDDYERRILIAPNRPELLTELTPLMEAMPGDPEWQAILARYR